MTRASRRRIALALAVLVAGASLGAPAGAETGLPTTAECGGLTGRPAFATWSHVVVIAFENKGYDDVLGPGAPAPYFQALAADCGVATEMHAIEFPSLPNYIALASGPIPPFIADDGSHKRGRDCTPGGPCVSHDPSIFSQLGGTGWSGWAESMPAPCSPDNSRDGLYVPRHNPAVYFTGLAGDCRVDDIPPPDPAIPSTTFTFVMPNTVDDMHSGPAQVEAGDAWLQRFLPPILASPDYQAGRTAVFLWFDTPTGQEGISTPIPFVVISNWTKPGSVLTTAFDHYSLLRTLQDMTEPAPAYLGHAGDASAADLRAAFNLCNATADPQGGCPSTRARIAPALRADAIRAP